MVFTRKRQGALALLQAVALFAISGVAARSSRCRPACSPDDSVVALLGSNDGSLSFCSEFLALPASTVSATVTPTVVTTLTETSYVTEAVTETDATTTVTVPAPTVPVATFSPVKRGQTAQQSVAYPTWLPATYLERRVSSACACLSVPLSVTTSTATADEAATQTEPATVTETTTTTLHATATATATAAPLAVKRSAKIEILRKSTLDNVGWLYYSAGPAIGTAAQAVAVSFTLDADATAGSQVRITMDGFAPLALGFVKDSNAANIVELENGYGSVANIEPTPPGSPPVYVTPTSKRESDIWTVDTITRMIGWNWITTSGAPATIHLYRVGGRLYPVGNVAAFNSATGGGSSTNYEVLLRFSLV
ncbi:hypothetical protein B0T24DRAFT_290348 [Lasiosphaeria ovina]|uniref:Uncharacterized protein n=1 Tax=Lasiosphaeria ovina TaxID=92902 RepID=A0AAE0N9C5_9PEZI|nr:hypothetical protein B0T24DRAFT_290348 [Lasiosphaeria ovina]